MLICEEYLKKIEILKEILRILLCITIYIALIILGVWLTW